MEEDRWHWSIPICMKHSWCVTCGKLLHYSTHWTWCWHNTSRELLSKHCEKGHEEPTLTVRQYKIQHGISIMTPHVCMLPGVLHRFHFKCFIVPFLSRNSSTLHLGWHQIRVHWTPLLIFLCGQNPGKGWRIGCWMTAVKCRNPSGGRVFFYSTVDFNVFYKARQMQTQCPAQHIWSTDHGH